MDMRFAHALPTPDYSILPVADRRVGSADAALQLFEPLRNVRQEVAAFVYLDPNWRILGLRHARHGTTDSVALSVRDIAADVIAFDATAVLMAHNHPSGDHAPSSADRDATRRIARALHALGVRLIDHLILARHGETSFRGLGLL